MCMCLKALTPCQVPLPVASIVRTDEISKNDFYALLLSSRMLQKLRENCSLAKQCEDLLS